MSFIKGIFNFVIMLILSVCLLLWFTYGILGSSVLSLDENKEMIETTQFTEEVTDEMLDRYHTSLNELNFDKSVLLEFVNESGLGVLGYVFLEYEQMPNVDVNFLKDYVIEQVAEEGMNRMDGNINIDSLVGVLRDLPEGDSVSNAIKSYTTDLGLNITQDDIDQVATVYLENKDLENDALINLIVESIATETLNLDEMNTELSLQELFDNLSEKNPFTVIRNVMTVVDKDMQGYLPLTIVLLICLIVIIEFRVGTASVWITLALLLSILPLQLLRVANFFIERDFLDIMVGLESYKDYMMTAMISKLNIYTIVVAVIIIVLFVLGKIFKNRVDTKIESAEKKKPSRLILIRLGVFAILSFGMFLNLNAARKYNTDIIQEVQEYTIADFEPYSIDMTLREMLNIDFDF